MTRTEKREWLWRYQASREERKLLEERCFKVEEKMFRYRSRMESCRTEKGRQRLQCAIDHCEAQMQKLDARWQQYENMKLEAKAAIESLPDKLMREMMAERYIRGMMWKKIAQRHAYSNSSVYLKHSQALDSLQLPVSWAA